MVKGAYVKQDNNFQIMLDINFGHVDDIPNQDLYVCVHSVYIIFATNIST